MTLLITGTIWAWNKRKYLIKILQKLNQLQTEMKFNPGKLKKITFIVILELICIYVILILAMVVGYPPDIDNFFLRIIIAASIGTTLMPILAAEIMFINAVAILTEYFKMANKQLKGLKYPVKLPYVW